MTTAQPAPDPERDAFLGYLRTALTHLYDPGALRAGPLPALFGLEGRGDRATALQRLLTDAIEACRPAAGAGAGAGPQTGAGAWRAYQVLRRRYIEQLPQATVAADLGLSVRQLQREEKQARELLADQLWARYDLDAARARLAPARKPRAAPRGKARATGRAGELAWLRDNTPAEVTDVVALARRVLETAAPLLRSLGVRADLTPAEIAPLSVQAVLLTQAVLSMVTAAARALPGGVVLVTPAYTRGALAFTVEGFAPSAPHPSPLPEGEGGASGPSPSGRGWVRGAADPLPEDEGAIRHSPPATGHPPSAISQTEDLAIARELAGLAAGRLTVETPNVGPVSRFTLRVPVAEQTPVLIIDDNADAHELYRRLLADTPFRPVSLRDPAGAVAMAAQTQPGAVLLDVMMPGEDGWALLGRLREHPATRTIPVIICTVLPQADLALTLGAAEFLRKPVNRAALLAALERCAAGS